EWNSKSISRLCLPPMQIHAKFIPYFKHLQIGNFLNENGEINIETEIMEFSPEFINAVNSVRREDFYPNQSYLKKKKEINQNHNSIYDIINSYDNDLHHLVFISLLDDDKINLDDLHKVLVDKIELLHNSRLGTYYRKLVCLYD